MKRDECIAYVDGELFTKCSTADGEAFTKSTREFGVFWAPTDLPEELDPFDDERLIRGLVTADEVAALMDQVIHEFLALAKERATVEVIWDSAAVDELWKSGELFAEDRFILEMDPATECVGRWNSVLCKVIRTPVGRFLAKWMMHAGVL